MSQSSRTTVRRGAVAIGRLAGIAAGAAFKRHGFGHGEIAAAWTELVGADLAGVSRPERLAWPRAGDSGRTGGGATLTVAVDGPRAIELQHAAPRVIEAVNMLYGYRAVGRIRLVQAGPARTSRPSPRRSPAAPRGSGDFDTINSPALRAALARLRGAALTRG